ncbi:MAG TPA: peptidoglycan editing factor PgeF [Leptolyngbyaceae cyanobacterium M33_DOE_097]|uniref:Purine nucleoside phosphorylase n=1 Tax=Oscillatoriales cyanobacterium SpSt-418 TaxID=2282169 RepID=A0A7C3PJS2_9CYAN|nr:peptidoglycan editing factor PgeF [Leptolyngbyaceae cyanobacterium M33_DOE_097]
MHTWQWQTWNDLPYLTCDLLDGWVHGFFTQQFWSRSPAHLAQVLQPETTSYRVKQVHGNTVLKASEAGIDQLDATELELPEADGLLSEQPDQAVWVCTADCTPVLIGDAATGQVSAIHAGWRGTARKIVPQAIAQMQASGSRLADLRIALGPAISGSVYQVTEEVAAEVVETVVETPGESPQSILEVAHQLASPPVMKDKAPGRAKLDVRRVISLQLEQMNINAEQVAIAPNCTYQEPDNFFSYRRTKEKKVQWSGIVSR